MTAQSVIQQPQMSMMRILRPYSTAYTVYQGKNGKYLLLVTENGEPLDELAGEGYSPNLVRGLPVVMGSRVNIWLPRLQPFTETLATYYNWVVTWRLRNVLDMQKTGKPAHSPVTSTVAGIQPVFAATHSVIYNQAEPTGTAPAVQHIAPEQFQVHPGGDISGAATNLPLPPYAPNGNPGAGALGQWEVIDLTAQGDELVIGCYKSDAAVWDFPDGQQDYLLREFLQTAGVLVMFGVTP